MSERHPTPSSGEQLHRISTWSRDADWSAAELKETLREGGIDPDRLVQRVLADVKPLLQPPDAAPRPLLVALREHTQMAPSAIAEAMEVPVTFLSVLSRHPVAVPTPWREELANRAARGLHVDPDVVLDAFSAPFQYERAASRDVPYAADAVETVADLLKRSGLSPEAAVFLANPRDRSCNIRASR